MTKKEFIEKVASLVIAENEYRGNPLFSSVVIAQACLETGYGKSSLMIKANAIFGIKATKTWKGKVYNSKTKECYDGVTYVTINDCFRAYNNFGESISDYFDLICKSSRYRKALVADSPKECITEIKNGGYATDPKYIDSIMKIIESNKLTKYDRQEKTESKESYKVGASYTLQVNLNVRYGAGTTYKIKKYSELTKDGRKHALNQRDAVLKRGTKVTCLKIVKNGNQIWLKYLQDLYVQNMEIKSMSNNCKCCSKQFFCKKEKCEFIRWLNTKNYGEVRRVKNGNCYNSK